MVFAVLGAISFTNTARRNNISNNLQQKISPAGMFGDIIIENRVGLSPHDTSGDPAIFVEIRFLAEADRDAFYSDAVASLTGANGPVTGSWLAKHTCTHDEVAHTPCVETERQTF